MVCGLIFSDRLNSDVGEVVFSLQNVQIWHAVVRDCDINYLQEASRMAYPGQASLL